MTVSATIEELLDAEKELKVSGLALLSGLLDDEQEELRSRWAEIEANRRREILARLIELADDSSELDFHAVYCTALADEDPTVRECAVNGLWESEDRRTIPKLTGRLHEDADERVRAAAATVLGHFAVLAATGKLVERDATRVFRSLMESLGNGDEAVAVRRRALEAIGAFAVPEVDEWVRWAYEADQPELRQSALHAMGRSGQQSWLPVIYREMQSGDPAMRYEAANAARGVGEREAVPFLAELIDDTDVEVALASVLAVGMIGGAKAKKLLRGVAAEGEDDVIREAAAEALRLTETDEGDLSMFKMKDQLG